MKLKNIGKRLASLALALALVAGLVPITARAAFFSREYGYKITIDNATLYSSYANQTYELVGSHIIIDEPKLNGNTVSLSFNAYFYVPNTTSETDAVRVEETFSLDCTKSFSKSGTYSSDPYSARRFTVEYTITREAGNHSGGNPTCTTPGKCEVCGKSYTVAENHKYEWKHNETKHWQECTENPTHKKAEGSHTGGTATCSAKAICSTCSASYGEINENNHAWGQWTIDDTHHSRVCTLNNTHTQNGEHSGGTATCVAQAVCNTCKTGYGSILSHNYTYTVSGSTLTESCDKGCRHTATATLAIPQSEYTYTGSAIEPATLSYSDNWQGERPTEISYTNNLNASRNENPATAKITVEGKELTQTFKINPKALELSMVTMNPASGSYTGTAHSAPTYILSYNGFLVRDLDYTAGQWTGDFLNAGDYTLELEGKGNFSGKLTLTYNIAKVAPTPELFRVAMRPLLLPVYDGTTAHSATVTSDAPGLGTFTVKYNGDIAAPINAGTYKVTVDVAEGSNYTAASGLFLVEFTVQKADAAIAVASNQVVTYDGAGTTTGTADADILYTYSGDGAVTVKWYNADGTEFTGGVPTNVGSYMVGISAAEGSNYKAVDEVKAPFTIVKADPVIGAVTAADIENSTDISKISLSRTDTSVEGALTVDPGQSLSWGDNTIAYTFTPTDLQNYNILTGTVNVKVVDTIVPTGIVTLAEKDWSALLENFQFDLFFKEAQTVVVDAQDNLSGVDTIEYYATSDSLDVAALNAVRDWIVMNSGSTVVALEDTRQFIYYIRLTDKAGNVAYISTNGAEYDTTAPAISGITDGETYYTTHTVTVTDKNLYTVTLNGTAVTAPITLEGNKDATYTIEATDRAGNTTSCTVTMQPIAALSEGIASLAEDNVTSDDEPALEAADEALHAAMAQGTPTDSELAQLRSAIDRIAKLENAVREAFDAVDTDSINSSLDITADDVQSEDKTQLETAKAELEAALEEHDSNYTDAEKQIIQDKIDQFAEALDVVEAVEAVTEQVNALPETADPTQEDVVLAIDQAKADYDALSDHGKELAGTALKEKLDALVADITAYAIVSGSGSSWTKDGSTGLRFTANGIFSKFVGVQIDGKDVDAANYDAVSGSTVVTLKPACLQKLRNGSHTITLVYTDGQASGSFTVVANHNTPDTGDNAHMVLWTCLLAMSAMALALLGKKRRAVK